MPLPNCAAAPESWRSWLTLTFVPLPADTIVEVTFMVAWPLPFSSDPDASITIRLADSFRSTIWAVPANCIFTGPILVVTRPLYTSPLTSVSSAPGMQGAIRGTSCMCFHTCSSGAATSNSLSISIDYSLSLPTGRGPNVQFTTLLPTQRMPRGPPRTPSCIPGSRNSTCFRRGPPCDARRQPTLPGRTRGRPPRRSRASPVPHPYPAPQQPSVSPTQPVPPPQSPGARL